MELQFPESLKTRIAANRKLIKKDKDPMGMSTHKEAFKASGNLMECRDSCGKCNICRFRKDAQAVLDNFAKMSSKRKVFDED